MGGDVDRGEACAMALSEVGPRMRLFLPKGFFPQFFAVLIVEERSFPGRRTDRSAWQRVSAGQRLEGRDECDPGMEVRRTDGEIRDETIHIFRGPFRISMARRSMEP